MARHAPHAMPELVDKEQVNSIHVDGAAMLQMSDGFTSYTSAAINRDAQIPPPRPIGDAKSGMDTPELVAKHCR